MKKTSIRFGQNAGTFHSKRMDVLKKARGLSFQSTAALFSKYRSFVANNRSFKKINLLFSENRQLIGYNHRGDFFNQGGDWTQPPRRLK